MPNSYTYTTLPVDGVPVPPRPRREGVLPPEEDEGVAITSSFSPAVAATQVSPVAAEQPVLPQNPTAFLPCSQITVAEAEALVEDPNVVFQTISSNDEVFVRKTGAEIAMYAGSTALRVPSELRIRVAAFPNFEFYGVLANGHAELLDLLSFNGSSVCNRPLAERLEVVLANQMVSGNKASALRLADVAFSESFKREMLAGLKRDKKKVLLVRSSSAKYNRPGRKVLFGRRMAF